MRKPICEFCGEYTKCVCRFETCSKCGESYSNFDPDESHAIYEYRGALACNNCFDSVIESRNFERQEIIEEEKHKLKPLEGLSLGDSVVGRANRQILKSSIEIAKKESGRIKAYEKRN